jgi:hypothetical protein
MGGASAPGYAAATRAEPHVLCTPGLFRPSHTLFRFMLPPSARILRMPGEIETEEWKCLAELIDNAFDDFNESMVFIILDAAARRCRFSLCASIASAPELNAFAIAVAACPLLALLLSVELLNRALKRHRFQAATFHSSRILPWSRPSPEPR